MLLISRLWVNQEWDLKPERFCSSKGIQIPAETGGTTVVCRVSGGVISCRLLCWCAWITSWVKCSLLTRSCNCSSVNCTTTWLLLLPLPVITGMDRVSWFFFWASGIKQNIATNKTLFTHLQHRWRAPLQRERWRHSRHRAESPQYHFRLVTSARLLLPADHIWWMNWTLPMTY